MFLSKLAVLGALAIQGSLLTSACTPIGAVASAGVAAGTLSAQERGFKTGVKDTEVFGTHDPTEDVGQRMPWPTSSLGS